MAEVQLLGPVQMSLAGRPVDLGPRKRRAVLAALALDANRPVPLQALVERVWDEAPPAARDVLYTHLSAIRRTLRQISAAGPGIVALLRRDGGYVLEIDPDRVDAHRFRRLVDQALVPGTPPTVQATVLRQALDLWRGPALADLPSAWAARGRQSWEQRRLAAARQWAETELRLGRPGAVVEELLALTAEHPLAEPLLALLMCALHADGRTAEALDHYASAQRRLADELGVDPGSELRRIHQAVLRGTLPAPHPAAGQPAAAAGQPAAAAGQPAAAAGPPTSADHPPVEPAPTPLDSAHPTPGRIPAQLPADVHAFTGRTRELADLDRHLASDQQTGAGDRSTAVVISAVSGTAGVGKTALALHWAHRVREKFPDGQLYVNLRGFDPDQPMPAVDALARFLSALGLPAPDISVDIEDRAAQYRTVIAGRRLLVVLDNAASVEQVRPLLPGTPTCVVVVTSRNSLPGLVAVHGARRLDLDLLPAADAVALLRALIGGRVDAEPEAADVLASHCAWLPLALRIAAELAAAQPTSPLSELLADLASPHDRLDLLDAGGDPRASIQNVFSWSYRHLPGDAARAFRLLGSHPGPDIDLYAAAALTGTDLHQAHRMLAQLTRANLVHHSGYGRYSMHDLLQAFASRLARTDAPNSERRDGLSRLFDHYLHTAAAATGTLFPAEQHRRTHVGAVTTSGRQISTPAAAGAWLDNERATLVNAASHADEHGWPAHAVALAAVLFRYLDGGYYSDAMTVHSHARDAAARIHDETAEAHALTDLGCTLFRQSRFPAAVEHLQQAYDIFARTGNEHGQARAANNLGIVNWALGQYTRAAEHHQQAADLYQKAGDRLGHAAAVKNLGIDYWQQGQYETAARHYHRAHDLFGQVDDRRGEAEALNCLGDFELQQTRFIRARNHYRKALGIYQQLGDHRGQAHTLDNIGDVDLHEGHPRAAADHYRQAVDIYQQLGDHRGQAHALDDLGRAELGQGHHQAATDHHQQALGIFRQIHHPAGEISALNGLGEAAQATGHNRRARIHHTAALALAIETGDRHEQARAHDGLARTFRSTGETDQARLHWRHALMLYTDLGISDADDVRAHLTALDRAGNGPDDQR